MENEGKKPEITETTQTVAGATGLKEVTENGHTYLVNEATGAKFFAGDYVEKVRQEAKTNREKLAEFEAAQEAARQKQLEEQCKFKELAAEVQAKHDALQKEYEAAQERLKAIDEANEAERKALLEKLPKEKQEIYADAPKQIIQDVLAVMTGSVANPDPAKAKLNQQQGGDKTKPWKGFYNTLAQ